VRVRGRDVERRGNDRDRGDDEPHRGVAARRAHVQPDRGRERRAGAARHPERADERAAPVGRSGAADERVGGRRPEHLPHDEHEHDPDEHGRRGRDEQREEGEAHHDERDRELRRRSDVRGPARHAHLHRHHDDRVDHEQDAPRRRTEAVRLRERHGQQRLERVVGDRRRARAREEQHEPPVGEHAQREELPRRAACARRPRQVERGGQRERVQHRDASMQRTPVEEDEACAEERTGERGDVERDAVRGERALAILVGDDVDDEREERRHAQRAEQRHRGEHRQCERNLDVRLDERERQEALADGAGDDQRPPADDVRHATADEAGHHPADRRAEEREPDGALLHVEPLERVEREEAVERVLRRDARRDDGEDRPRARHDRAADEPLEVSRPHVSRS
jgi:hypothetical protein